MAQAKSSRFVLTQCCQHVFALSDDRTSLGLSLYSLIIPTGFVSIDLRLKKIMNFCGFLSSVCRIFVAYVLHKEHFHIHKVVAKQVEEDLFAIKVPLNVYCSRFNNTDDE